MDLVAIALDVCQGMVFFSGRHPPVHPQGPCILLDGAGNQPHVKVSDFGLSRFASTEWSVIHSESVGAVFPWVRNLMKIGNPLAVVTQVASTQHTIAARATTSPPSSRYE